MSVQVDTVFVYHLLLSRAKLADSEEDLRELDLGFSDTTLKQFWEKVHEVSQSVEEWLQRQAAEKTRQQQIEEEERVYLPRTSAVAHPLTAELLCTSTDSFCLGTVEASTDAASAGGGQAARNR